MDVMGVVVGMTIRESTVRNRLGDLIVVEGENAYGADECEDA